jgi:DNA polymerase III epsilon subunit-like protein
MMIDVGSVPREIAIIDIETTGLDPAVDSIIQVGMVVLDVGTGEIRPLLNVTCQERDKHVSSDAWIFKQSKLSYERVLCSSDFSVYLPELQSLVSRYCCTSYNIRFDFGFLESRGIRFGAVFKDIMMIAGAVCKYIDSINKVSNIPPRYSMERVYSTLFPSRAYSESHLALEDAIDEAKILYRCLLLLSFLIKRDDNLVKFG